MVAFPVGAQQRAGEVRALVPTGHIVRGGGPPAEARRADPVFWEDVVRTERGGRVRLGLEDGSILNVGSESVLKIMQHDRQSQQTTVDLVYGRLRAKVVRLARPGAEFRVRTPIANAGVVGTRFVVRALPDFTEVFCLEGAVRVRNRDDAVPGEVTLRPGEFTRVARGLAPTSPVPASPEQLRQAEEETDLPAAPAVSRAEISWPPGSCSAGAELLLRGWTKQLEEGKEVESALDTELLSGTLRLGAESLYVEGGRANFAAATAGSVPEGAFTPAGAAAAVPTKVWPPLEIAEGEGWRAPRAVFVGSAFYVLGPMGVGGAPSFTFGGQPATLLWQSPCGAGFLAPRLPGAEYDVTLSVTGAPVARGKMNLIEVGYRLPVPPAVLRGQQASFGIDLRGLAGLDRATAGRPVLIVNLANQTPLVIGELRSSTPGASATGETITYLVSAPNIDAAGAVRLDGSGRGRQAGAFSLGVTMKLDDALEKPRTPLAPVR